MSRVSVPYVVHKFGGAALEDAPTIARVCEILASRVSAERPVVVTSALRGVTNELVAATTLAGNGDETRARAIVEEIRARHVGVVRELLVDRVLPDVVDALLQHVHAHCDELHQQLHLLGARGVRDDALADAVLSHGERLAARILCVAMQAHDVIGTVVDATQLIATDGRHGDAAPDLAQTDALAQPALRAAFTHAAFVVVPGFIGAGTNGAVVTLGRGGSDLSATLLGRALQAEEVVLWKDVPGLLTADPRVEPDARVIATLDAREASELAYYGARVLHPRTLMPLRDGMVLRLRPFADPHAAGTMIVAGRTARGAPVRAISGMSRQALVAVNGTGMLGVPGVAARVFAALADARISVSMISQASSEQSICFTIPSERAADVIGLLRTAFAQEIARREVDDVTVLDTLMTIAVVGSGMAHTPGIASRIFGAVADAGVNVVAIAQGASERNVSFVVRETEAPTAVRAVHAAFHLAKVGGGRARRRREPMDVVLLGAGRVAQALTIELASLARGATPAVRVIAMIDRTGAVHQPRGLTSRQLTAIGLHKREGKPLSELPGGWSASAAESIEQIAKHALVHPVLVDVASGDTSDALLAALHHGMNLVLANKAPLAGPMARARAILHDARANGRRVLHEATVGAGLPVIDTLQQLHASGDRVDSVDSSPSGTMGFLFSEMGRGRAFSEVVRDAMSRGYTEPDPRDDLSGLDVARKGLILARLLGYTGALEDVNIESLVPERMRDLARDEFLDALPNCDEEWATRVEEARSRGEVLRYRARATRGGVRVGLASVPASSALASLDGTDNLFVFTTARYRNRPLVVSGPGAGVEVTAAGVLGDILRLSPR